MARAVWCAFFILSLSLSAGCRAGARDQTVERMDVTLAVLTDGSLAVEERLAVRFGATPSSEFRRHTPVWRHDGVFGIEAQMDGATFAPGEGRGRIQVPPGEALDVRWSFAPTSDATHVFLLRYRAANVVEVSGIRGTVSWRVLPADREFDVQAVNVTLSLPSGAVLLQDPWVDEAGWTVQRDPAGLSASRTGVSRGESGTAGAEFTIDTMAVGQPAWQYHRARAREFAPAFISAGLFLLIIGAGVLGMLRLKFARHPVPSRAAPSSVPAAMRVAVRRGHPRADMGEVLAAVRGLHAAGAVLADTVPSASTRVRKGALVPMLTHHEQMLLDAVWFRESGGVAASGLLPRRRRRAFRQAMVMDLVAAGLADAERVAARRDLWIAGLVVLVVGVVAWWAVATMFLQFGQAALAVPAGLLGAAVMFLAGARSFSILSETGEIARADWHKLLD